MNLDFLVSTLTWNWYLLTGHLKWPMYAFIIVFGTLLLKTVNNMDWRVRFFLVVVLTWHLVSVLDFAIDDGLKNECTHKGCTFTVSTSRDVQIEESEPSENVDALGSDRSNSSEQPMEESNHPQDSSSVHPNTDAPPATAESGETL